MKNRYCWLLFVVLLLTHTLSIAAEQTASDYKTHPSYRFSRGVINTISSPLELPAQMYSRAVYRDERSNNPFAVAGGFIEGIPMGFVYFGWRFAAGIYDLTTFPFSCYSKCIIKPEYVTFSPKFLEEE